MVDFGSIRARSWKDLFCDFVTFLRKNPRAATGETSSVAARELSSAVMGDMSLGQHGTQVSVPTGDGGQAP